MSPSRQPCFVYETEGSWRDGQDTGGRPDNRAASAASQEPPGFRWTVLRRHGKRPLAVLGRVLMRGNNRCTGLPCWSEISVLETASGRFAISLCHAAPGAAGPTWCDSFLCDTPAAVREVCLRHDPLMALPSCSAPGGTVPTMPLVLSITGLSGSGNTASVEALAARRFSGAWAGLLAAMLGPHAACRPVA